MFSSRVPGRTQPGAAGHAAARAQPDRAPPRALRYPAKNAAGSLTQAARRGSGREAAAAVRHPVPWRPLVNDLACALGALDPRQLVGRLRRSILLPPLVRQLAADPVAAVGDDAFLARLGSAWGNGGYPAHPDYLRAGFAAVLAGGGDVLECGSGLSTLVLGAAARLAGVRVWSLEHIRAWASDVNALAERAGLAGAARVLHAPLVDYGGYSWYGAPAALPGAPFRVVVCDGPPRRTPGGRYGLLPVMRPRLAEGATILLDDAARDGERAVLGQWSAETGGCFEERGCAKPYAVFTVPGTA